MSCLYLAATDGQFSSQEQEWVDFQFGIGASEQFISDYETIDWDNLFNRIHNLVISLKPNERTLIENGLCLWLQELMEVDGVVMEGQTRLMDFIKFLRETTLDVQPLFADGQLADPSSETLPVGSGKPPLPAVTFTVAVGIIRRIWKQLAGGVVGIAWIILLIKSQDEMSLFFSILLLVFLVYFPWRFWRKEFYEVSPWVVAMWMIFNSFAYLFGGERLFKGEPYWFEHTLLFFSLMFWSYIFVYGDE